MFDIADLDVFTCGDVLAHFGLPVTSRGPCPLCQTSRESVAFSIRGHLWKCFACGRGGNNVGLYAALAGITAWQAVQAIAGHLGLSAESDPKALAEIRSAREAARAEVERLERKASIRFRVAAWKLDYLREVASRARVDSPFAGEILAGLYREIGDCEAIVLREYPLRGWV